MMLDDWLKTLEPVSWLEIGVYTAVVLISLLTCYLVGVSIFVSGTPWNSGVTDNVLNWLQIVALSIIVLQLERLCSHCCQIKKELSGIKKKK